MTKEKPELERIDLLFSSILRKIFLHPGSKVSVPDVTFSQMKTLFFLSFIPECKMTELAHSLSVTLPTATSIVDTLVRKGFVERFGVKSDRRMVALKLMPKGRLIIDAHKKHRRQQLAGIFSKLKPSDQKKFLLSLERIYNVLENTENNRIN